MTYAAAAAAQEPHGAGPGISTAVGPPPAAGPSTATAAAQPGLHAQQGSAAPQACAKTLYLIRHGEGWHNIGYEQNVDAHLTPRGWAQAAALQQHLAALQPQLHIELVVVSPLRRTLETAAGVFGAAAPPPAAAAAVTATATATAGAAASHTSDHTSSSHGSWVWMHPQQHKATEVTRRAMIYLPAAGAAAAAAFGNAGLSSSAAGGGEAGPAASLQQHQQHAALRIVAHEGCRERIGPNPCDRFRDIPLQAADFPGVDFSLLRHVSDEAWAAVGSAPALDGGCYSIGEAESATEQRALEFYRWIMTRPESHIAVVSHCGFLVHGMRALSKAMLHTWSDAMLQQCASNSSSSSSSVTSSSTNGASDPTADSSGQLLSEVDGVMDIGSSGASKEPDSKSVTNGVMFDCQLAERLRAAADEVGGRMSVDWANCELRSLELAWVPAGALLVNGQTAASGQTAAVGQTTAGGPGSSGSAAGGWLWAAPGDGGQWWPGGSAGV